MSTADWTYESKYTIVKAGPELQERFRKATRERFKAYGEQNPADEEVEDMAAFAWHVRAEEVCAKADVLIEEGVSADEVRRILKVEPGP